MAAQGVRVTTPADLAGAPRHELLAALTAHASQTGHQGAGLERMLREWNGRTAAAAGLPEGRLAEAFAVTRINA